MTTALINIIIFSIILNIIQTLYFSKKKRVIAFRQGIKWGLELFARCEQTNEGKFILVVGKSNPTKITDLYKKIDKGEWDDVYKNKKQ